MPDYDREQWLERMWRSHARAVWSYAARRVGVDHAEDIVASTFVVLWRRSEEFRPSAHRGLAIGIARKVVSDQHRSTARGQSLIDRISAQPDARVTDGSHALDVAEVARVLNPADLEILLLLAWDGLSPREIAAVFEISPGAARKRIHDIRKRAKLAIGRTTQTQPGAPAAALKENRT